MTRAKIYLAKLKYIYLRQNLGRVTLGICELCSAACLLIRTYEIHNQKFPTKKNKVPIIVITFSKLIRQQVIQLHLNPIVWKYRQGSFRMLLIFCPNKTDFKNFDGFIINSQIWHNCRFNGVILQPAVTWKSLEKLGIFTSQLKQ
jgi:hypothetical protein